MPMLRFVLALSLVALAVPAAGQSYVDRSPGVALGLDFAGGAFPALTPAGVDVSGSLGARLGRGVDVAVLLGYGGAVADTLFPYPAEVHVGAEASVAVGPEASPWRVGVSALATVAGASTFAFPAGDGPTEVRGGSDVIEWRARAQAARFVRLVGGPVRVWAAGGVFATVRRVEGSTLIFGAGGPDENVVGGDAVTEKGAGVLLALPVAVDLGRGTALAFEPELRVWIPEILLGGFDGQVTVRLNL